MRVSGSFVLSLPRSYAGAGSFVLSLLRACAGSFVLSLLRAQAGCADKERMQQFCLPNRAFWFLHAPMEYAFQFILGEGGIPMQRSLPSVGFNQREYLDQYLLNCSRTLRFSRSRLRQVAYNSLHDPLRQALFPVPTKNIANASQTINTTKSAKITLKPQETKLTYPRLLIYIRGSWWDYTTVKLTCPSKFY